MTYLEINSFLELVERYSKGDLLTEEEISLLDLGMQESDCLRALDEKMSLEIDPDFPVYTPEDIDAGDSFRREALIRFKARLKSISDLEQRGSETSAVERLDPALQKNNRKRGRLEGRIRTKRIVAAAVLTGSLVVLSGIMLLQSGKGGEDQRLTANRQAYHRTVPIVPGSSGAILTLGNGRKIALGTPHKGLMHIGALTIQQDRDAATFSNNLSGNGKVLYNTLTTPRGRQFQIALPDGTKVWLNASSSLTFPTVFNKDNRTVELEGEAYFEVVHNASHPFQVRTGNQLIEDIGTKFNVRAYGDEPVMQTALVEGAVEISNGPQNLTLTPGQQVKVHDRQMAVSKADLNQILAWKAGFFAFQNANVEDIMRQLSRWYDVDIRYAHNRDQRNGGGAQRFTGRIDRSIDLQDLLDGLQFSQLHFKIDKNNRTIIIEN